MLADFDNLRRLPVSDKLELVEILWDDILASTEPANLPAAVRTEAEERLAAVTADPSLLIDEEELWQRVDQPRG